MDTGKEQTGKGQAVKQQIAADLQKAKAAGGTRVERIRQIFKEALTQTVTELKAGGGDLQSIAKGSAAAVAENLKEQPSPTPNVSVPVEVIIESGDEHQDKPQEAVPAPVVPVASAESIAVEILPPAAQTAPTQPAIDTAAETASSAMVATSATPEATPSLSDSLKLAAERLLRSIRQSEAYEALQPQIIRLKEKLSALDAKLTNRYGERYKSVKQEFNQDAAKAKVWYERAKAEAKATGTTWIEQKQAQIETKMDTAGATIAQREQQIKQRLKQWQKGSKA